MLMKLLLYTAAFYADSWWLIQYILTFTGGLPPPPPPPHTLGLDYNLSTHTTKNHWPGLQPVYTHYKIPILGV